MAHDETARAFNQYQLRRLLTPLIVGCSFLCGVSCDSSTPTSENGSLTGGRGGTVLGQSTDAFVSDHSDNTHGEDLGFQVDAQIDAAVTTAPDAQVLSDRQTQFYEPDTIQRIDIIIEPEDRHRMVSALPDLIYVRGRFRWNDVEIDNVGIRFKGNSSSSPDAWWKRSLLVKFGEFVDGQRFFGLRRVALDNAVQFGSLFSERLITDILRNEGVPCSRANYAEVTINGVYDGLFVNVERIDKSFLERVFQNRDGVLYKNHVGGPGSELTVLENAESYAQSFEPKTHKKEADYSELLELAVLLRDTPDAELESTLESVFELESFLKIMAVMVLSGAFDQYTGQAPHNFYMYKNPPTGRMNYLPWDLDVGFADNAFGRLPVIDGWNASWPLFKVPRPLVERILQNETLRRRYLRHAGRILEQYFRPDKIHERLDYLYEQARPSLDRDPYPPRRVTVPADMSYLDIIRSLKDFMVRRYETARMQLDSPASQPPRSAQQNRDPMPGPSVPDDPTELKVAVIDENGVTLTWTDNSNREGLTIVQRCEGEECANFANRFGVQPDRPPRAVDPQIRSGRVYRYRVYAAWPTPEGPQGSAPSNVVEARP